jgi:hypothetical protein
LTWQLVYEQSGTKTAAFQQTAMKTTQYNTVMKNGNPKGPKSNYTYYIFVRIQPWLVLDLGERNSESSIDRQSVDLLNPQRSNDYPEGW